jgi:hypothetical protein
MQKVALRSRSSRWFAGPYRSSADDVAERLGANAEPMNHAAPEEAGKLVVSQAAELP